MENLNYKEIGKRIQTKRKDLIYARNVHDTPDFSNTKH